MACSGHAFKNIVLDGNVTHISSQAVNKLGLPTFEIAVMVEHLTSRQRNEIRLGMSANLSLLIYENPAALVLPVEAILIEGTGRYVNMVDKKTRHIEKVAVQTGITTLDAVEILSGLKKGDEVALSLPAH